MAEVSSLDTMRRIWICASARITVDTPMKIRPSIAASLQASGDSRGHSAMVTPPSPSRTADIRNSLRRSPSISAARSTVSIGAA